MARRSRALRIDDHRLRDAHHPSLSTRPHYRDPVVLEDRHAIQVREIQSLLEENQRLASGHLTLKHELTAAKQELHRVSAQAVDTKAESDARVRGLYMKSLEMEGEVRDVDEMSAALAQVRADVQTLAVARQELAEQLQAVDDNITRARSEVQKLPTIKAEIESMHKEIQRGRAAIELEKKTRAHNFEQRQLMERTTISMAREIKKLQAELAEEKRARAAAAQAKAAADASIGYAASYNNPGGPYRGKSYHDPHDTDEVRGDADAGPYSGSETTPHGTDDSRRTHVYSLSGRLILPKAPTHNNDPFPREMIPPPYDVDEDRAGLATTIICASPVPPLDFLQVHLLIIIRKRRKSRNKSAHYKDKIGWRRPAVDSIMRIKEVGEGDDAVNWEPPHLLNRHYPDD